MRSAKGESPSPCAVAATERQRFARSGVVLPARCQFLADRALQFGSAEHRICNRLRELAAVKPAARPNHLGHSCLGIRQVYREPFANRQRLLDSISKPVAEMLCTVTLAASPEGEAPSVSSRIRRRGARDFPECLGNLSKWAAIAIPGSPACGIRSNDCG